MLCYVQVLQMFLSRAHGVIHSTARLVAKPKSMEEPSVVSSEGVVSCKGCSLQETSLFFKCIGLIPEWFADDPHAWT